MSEIKSVSQKNYDLDDFRSSFEAIFYQFSQIDIKLNSIYEMVEALSHFEDVSQEDDQD